jgi:gliding motility-associated-like protein
LALIKSSDDAGTTPFVVKFSNATEEYSYQWDFGDGNISIEASPEHIYREAGNYTVKLIVKNKAGTTDVNKKTIEVFEGAEISLVPNVITPNNDGSNDTYKVIGKNIVLFNLRIFNTKGVLLFQTSDINNGWNGEDLKGNPMPEGNYIVQIEAIGKNNNRIVKDEIFRIER